MEDTIQEAPPRFSTVLFQLSSAATGGGRGSSLSFLPFRGITQLKEKWSDYKQPRRPRRLASFFVSEEGDYVAVASRNQITILQKDDDYQEPVETFQCGKAGTFTCGTWSESHALLGVVDDTNTIYIIKPNGEEITRIARRHLNITLPIVGLIVNDNTYEKSSPLRSFTNFLLDGLFHDIEISEDSSASNFSTQALNTSMLRQRVQDVYCCDCCPKISLLAVVSSTGDIQSTSNKSSGVIFTLFLHSHSPQS